MAGFGAHSLLGHSSQAGDGQLGLGWESGGREVAARGYRAYSGPVGPSMMSQDTGLDKGLISEIYKELIHL